MIPISRNKIDLGTNLLQEGLFSERSRYQVAILLIGLKRDYDEIRDYIINNIILELERQDAHVDVFVCSDQTIDIPRKRDEKLRVGFPADPRQHVQMQRAAFCYNNIVRPYMKRFNKRYDFFVKVRPDFIVFRKKYSMGLFVMLIFK